MKMCTELYVVIMLVIMCGYYIYIASYCLLLYHGFMFEQMEEYAKAEESSRKARVSFISHQVLCSLAIKWHLCLHSMQILMTMPLKK